MNISTSDNSSYRSNEWNEEIDYWALLRPIWERKWSVLIVALLTLLATFVALHVITPVYRSTATLQIAQPPNVVGIKDDVQPGSGNSNDYFKTQVEILKSRTLAQQTVTTLALGTAPEFDPNQPSNRIRLAWPGWLPARLAPASWPLPAVKLPDWLPQVTLVATSQANDPPAVHNADVLKAFSKRLTIEPIPSTQLVKVSFQAHDPKLAASIANTLSKLYIDSDRSARIEANLAAADELKKHLEDLRDKVEQSEQVLQKFREKDGIVEQDGTPLARAKLTILNEQVVAAERRAAEAEYNYRQVSRNPNASADYLLSLQPIQQDPLMQKLLLERQALEGKLAKDRKLYGDKHPKIVTLETDIDVTNGEIKKRLADVIGALKHANDAAQANLAELKQALHGAEQVMQASNRKTYKYERLKRDVETNRQLYDQFLKRIKEMEIPIQSANARVIDTAVAATKPFTPDERKMLLVGGMAGLILGLAWALFREYTDTSLRRVDDVENRLDIPLLSYLPRVKPRRGSSPALAYRDKPKAPFAEGIRTLRTSVIFSGLDESRKVIVVSSAVPSEGKSTVSVNLALALSSTASVLLIDADLRKPSLAKACGLHPATPGLSHYAAERNTLDECLHPVQGTQLMLMPSGVKPPSPLDLLSSKRVAALLQQLKQRFQYVIIDGPPVLAVSDTLVLSKHASQVILVTRANSTSYKLVRLAARQLAKSNAPVTGIVLNQVKAKYQPDYGYGYGYGAVTS